VTEPPALFADVLREPRAEARLRRQKLAEAPGLRPRATQRSETGRYPHKDTVRLRIVRKLRCCPWRAGRLARAIHVLQAREIGR
jgi:hypothetical protein